MFVIFSYSFLAYSGTKVLLSCLTNLLHDNPEGGASGHHISFSLYMGIFDGHAPHNLLILQL